MRAVTDWTRKSQTLREREKRERERERESKLGQTEIQTAGPLSMNPHQVETQFTSSQLLPVSVSGLIPSSSAASVPCWCGKCQHQFIETQTVPEHSTRLPEACITRLATDLTIRYINLYKITFLVISPVSSVG